MRDAGGDELRAIRGQCAVLAPLRRHRAPLVVAGMLWGAACLAGAPFLAVPRARATRRAAMPGPACRCALRSLMRLRGGREEGRSRRRRRLRLEQERAEPPLPEGWTIQYDDDGADFYFHEASQTRQHNHPLRQPPKDEDESIGAGAEQVPQAEAPLPGGWTKQCDEDGTVFYFDEISQARQAHHPLSAPPVPRNAAASAVLANGSGAHAEAAEYTLARPGPPAPPTPTRRSRPADAEAPDGGDVGGPSVAQEQDAEQPRWSLTGAPWRVGAPAADPMETAWRRLGGRCIHARTHTHARARAHTHAHTHTHTRTHTCISAGDARLRDDARRSVTGGGWDRVCMYI